MLRVPRDLHLLFESSASVLGRVPCHYFRSSRDLHNGSGSCEQHPVRVCTVPTVARVHDFVPSPMREVRVVAACSISRTSV